MSIEEGLPASSRQVHATALIVVIVVIILAAFSAVLEYLGGGEPKLLNSILQNMIAGVLAAFVLALTYRFVVKWIDPRDRVIEIRSSAITQRLIKNARKSMGYTFVGNTATFVSSSIIPLLCATVRTTGRSVSVRVFVIDPRENTVVAAYVAHKDRVKLTSAHTSNEDSAAWTYPIKVVEGETIEEVQAKLISCIYLCAYAARHSGVQLELFLRTAFTPFRADITDSEVVLTQESASEPAVAFSSSGVFYSWYQKEVQSLIEQCTRVELTSDKKFREPPIVHPSAGAPSLKVSLELLLISVFGNGHSFGEEVIDRAVERIALPGHDYQK